VVDLLEVPKHRRESIERLARELRAGVVAGRSAVLSTHINSDGDGCGSEVALAHLLAQMDINARIVNPTPWPELFRFLLTGIKEESQKGIAGLNGADVLMVLDISDVKRLGSLSDTVRALKIPKLVIDHHIPGDQPPGDIIFTDITACATGELIYDFAQVLNLEITPQIATALYVAIMTDTGSFRFSNTTPRAHTIAGDLLLKGVDPEEMYRRIYASVPLGKMHLLRDALATLEVDSQHKLAWISVADGEVHKYGLKPEDLDGLADYPRSIADTQLAMFFRDLGHGRVKVSFRSTEEVDVNAFAREFGGGGHVRASGALIMGTMDEVRNKVVEAARKLT
jgi:phosphoesterase RecJ-like protein